MTITRGLGGFVSRLTRPWRTFVPLGSSPGVRFAFVVFVLGVFVFVGFVVAGSIAAFKTASAAHDPVIPVGARVAGLDVGGRSLSEAAELIESEFAVGLDKPVHVRVGGRRRTLTTAAVDLHFDALRSARRANIAARRAVQRGDDPATVDVQPWVRFSRLRVNRFVRRVAAVVHRPARNARLRFTVTKLAIRRGREGRDIKRRLLRAQIVRTLSAPHASRRLHARRRSVAPASTRRDVLRRHPVVVTVHRRGFRLRVFRRGRRVGSYSVAVGMPGHRTPRGRFRIANKAKNPAWSAPDRAWAGAYRDEVIAGGEPHNPLKARWLGIVDGVGIHGTDATWSIGRAASHGCIRMAVRAVKRVYRLVPVGATVMIK
jgi:lipoprotein-anchoring transpeptidase ErfK/SrfK